MTSTGTVILRTALVWMLLELAAAAQVRQEGHRVLWSWARTVVRPVVVAAKWTAQTTTDLAWGLGNVSQLVGEVQDLRRELEISRSRTLLLSEDLESLREARDLAVAFRELTPTSVAARCTFRDIMRGHLQVELGTDHAVHPDTPVLGPGGVVGRVIRWDGDFAWVECLTNPAAAIAVTTPDGQVNGLAVGSGEGDLRVEFIPPRAPLLRGSMLETSGADGIFPPGIPVAVVTEIRQRRSSFLDVRADPLVDLTRTRVVLLVPSWNPPPSANGGAP